MPDMSILAAHCVFGAYGFWLPNDPRGSGSKFVGAENLLPFGKAMYLENRSRSVASQSHDARRRLAAKEALSRPAVRFNEAQVQAVAEGFGAYIRARRLTVSACSIMPDHVHMVIAKHEISFEQLVSKLKSNATSALVKGHRHPFAELSLKTRELPTCWGGRGWNAFLVNEKQILERIRYVEVNPIKSGLAPQTWSFVVPYPQVFRLY
jgi:REP-associated tyrosine transposase